MTDRRYEIGVEETRYWDEEEEMAEEECEEEDLLSNDEAENSQFNPIPYHFKLKDVLGKPVDLLPDDMAKVRVNCPPFHTLLDHCLAVLWLAFNGSSDNQDMLHSGDLNWAIKFLEGLKNSQNRRTEDVQMAMEYLQKALHNLCVNIHVDDVRRRKFKRYMNLSRSINALQFNRGVVLKCAEEGSPDYAAFVKCLDRRNNASYLDSTGHPLDTTTCPTDTCGSPCPSCGSPCPMDPCGSPCPINPCGSPCPASACPPVPCPADSSRSPCRAPCPNEQSRFPDQSRSPCPTDVCASKQQVCDNDDPEPDVCEMLDLIGETTPIILMDLLDHQPELLAKAMAKNDDDCDININVGSSECLPDDELCLLNEESAKEAKEAQVKDALCQIKNAELILSKYFNLTDKRDFLPDGTYREGSGAYRDDLERTRELDTKRSGSCQRNLY